MTEKSLLSRFPLFKETMHLLTPGSPHSKNPYTLEPSTLPIQRYFSTLNTDFLFNKKNLVNREKITTLQPKIEKMV